MGAFLKCLCVDLSEFFCNYPALFVLYITDDASATEEKRLFLSRMRFRVDLMGSPGLSMIGSLPQFISFLMPIMGIIEYPRPARTACSKASLEGVPSSFPLALNNIPNFLIIRFFGFLDQDLLPKVL